jgi:small conductance mechanosensitive channel
MNFWSDYIVPHSRAWLLASVILLAGFIAIKLITLAMRRFFNRVNLDETAELFFQRLTQVFLWSVLFIAVLANLGVNVTGFIAGLGAAGIIIGFATKDIFSNLAAGLLLLITKPIKVHDTVEIGGIKGVVEKVNISYCVITADGKESVAIPNTKVWGNPIRNYSRTIV